MKTHTGVRLRYGATCLFRLHLLPGLLRPQRRFQLREVLPHLLCSGHQRVDVHHGGSHSPCRAPGRGGVRRGACAVGFTKSTFHCQCCTGKGDWGRAPSLPLRLYARLASTSFVELALVRRISVHRLQGTLPGDPVLTAVGGGCASRNSTNPSCLPNGRVDVGPPANPSSDSCSGDSYSCEAWLMLRSHHDGVVQVVACSRWQHL